MIKTISGEVIVNSTAVNLWAEHVDGKLGATQTIYQFGIFKGVGMSWLASTYGATNTAYSVLRHFLENEYADEADKFMETMEMHDLYAKFAKEFLSHGGPRFRILGQQIRDWIHAELPAARRKPEWLTEPVPGDPGGAANF